MAINYYVFGDNKSKKEALTKTEVDDIVQTLEQKIVDSYTIPVINNDITFNNWESLFEHYNLDIKKPALIRNTSSSNFSYSHYYRVETMGTYQVVYLLNGELKVVEAAATINPQSLIVTVYFNDDTTLEPNAVALYQFIDFTRL